MKAGKRVTDLPSSARGRRRGGELARIGRACAVVGVLAIAGGAQAQTTPPGPAITSTYTVDRENQRVVVNVIKRGQIPGGDPAVTDFDIRFGDAPWLPPASTPPTDFRAPPGWSWEPIPGGAGWRVVTTPGWDGTNTQFELPYRGNPPGDAIELEATGFGDQHLPVYNFVSQPPEFAAGTVPRRYVLPSGGVAAPGFFAGALGSCGRPREFEGEFVLSTDARGVLTVREPRTGDVVTGRVTSNGAFRLAGETEVYLGAITGTRLAATYESMRAGCTSAYVARLTLERPGRYVPTCARPTIVAPTRARVLRGARIQLRIGATCAGSRLSNWPMAITLRSAGRTFRVGSFRTTLAARAVTVRLGGTRPRELVVVARAGQGLRAATRRVRLVYAG